MKAIKKINNNVAICVDGNGDEVVVIGKGIGFPEMPYEIADMSSIERTFYGVSSQYFNLLKDINKEMFEIASTIIEYADWQIDREFNPNLCFTLADHINFAIERYQKNISIKAPFVGDIKSMYPKEYEISEKAVSYINKKFNIYLPKSEAISIALHLINGEDFNTKTNDELDVNEIIDEVIDIIEEKMNFKVGRDSVNCTRFGTHLAFLLKRMQTKEVLESNNTVMFESIKENYPNVYGCALEVSKYLSEMTSNELNDEEIMYLMLHINRMCSREI